MSMILAIGFDWGSAVEHFDTISILRVSMLLSMWIRTVVWLNKARKAETTPAVKRRFTVALIASWIIVIAYMVQLAGPFSLVDFIRVFQWIGFVAPLMVASWPKYRLANQPYLVPAVGAEIRTAITTDAQVLGHLQGAQDEAMADAREEAMEEGREQAREGVRTEAREGAHEGAVEGVREEAARGVEVARQGAHEGAVEGVREEVVQKVLPALRRVTA